MDFQSFDNNKVVISLYSHQT